MPFRLENAQATFQRAMDIILLSLQWQLALVCLGDIVVFYKLLVDHIEEVEHPMRLFIEVGFSLS